MGDNEPPEDRTNPEPTEPTEPATPPAGFGPTPAGSDPVPTGFGHVPATQPPPPPGMDAEEYRRFQEFQRFQDFQRFTEAQHQAGGPAAPGGALVPVPPPGEPVPAGQQGSTDLHQHLAGMSQQIAELSASQARVERVVNPPTWKKVLRNKWLHRLVWLVVIVIVGVWGVPLLIRSFFGNSAGSNPASLHPAPIQGSGRLEHDPKDSVAAVYHVIAESPPDTACLEFTPAGATTFAHDLGASDCTQAVTRLHARLTPSAKNAYGEVAVLDDAVTITGSTAEISSCRMQIADGPRLGAFLLTQNTEGEWQITGHRAEPDPCPAPPPTTPAVPTS